MKNRAAAPATAPSRSRLATKSRVRDAVLVADLSVICRPVQQLFDAMEQVGQDRPPRDRIVKERGHVEPDERFIQLDRIGVVIENPAEGATFAPFVELRARPFGIGLAILGATLNLGLLWQSHPLI